MVSAYRARLHGHVRVYGASDEQESIPTIHRAIELGCTFLDTADMYGSGKNEELIGRAIKDRRQKVEEDEFGKMRGPNGEFLGVKGTPDYVKQACDASLKRLGHADVIDLYDHRVDKTVPIEDTVGAMAELVKAGKVRYLGLRGVARRHSARAQSPSHHRTAK